MAIVYTFIWWDELDREDVPCMCIMCAKKAKWYPFSITTQRGNWVDRKNVTRKTNLPFCPTHRGQDTMLSTAYLHTKGSCEEGLWVYGISDDFIEALKKHRKSEAAEWKKENPDADLSDFDELKLPPALRSEPVMPDTSLAKNPMFWLFAGLVAVVLLVMGCGVCMMVGMTIFGMTR
jgi:hypothetical protein